VLQVQPVLPFSVFPSLYLWLVCSFCACIDKLFGAATFLIKAKAQRGEPANEEANIQADEAIAGKDVLTEWHDRTNREVFTWQEPRGKRRQGEL